MDKEDMLPISYKHRIESYSQKLIGSCDSICIADKYDMRFLVPQYIIESADEERTKKYLIDSTKADWAEKDLKVGSISFMNLQAVLFTPNLKNSNCEDILEIIRDDHGAYEEYKLLCKHIAKARIVADYIAAMTDRYAEKKYNEIKSSSTSWSYSFRE